MRPVKNAGRSAGCDTPLPFSPSRPTDVTYEEPAELIVKRRTRPPISTEGAARCLGARAPVLSAAATSPYLPRR